MKKRKKGLAVILAITVVLTVIISVPAMAANAKTVNYYDENGNPITINGIYYNSEGYPMFNASSYYLDANGDSVYVGGCRVYYYNQNGDLVAGNYYYDTNGNAVSKPTSYPGGWGCGMWYYNSQGNVVNTTVYYDDFGNPVDPPATTPTPNYPTPTPNYPTPTPNYRGGWGCGCGWCGGWRR